jgi:hypothetical protein
MAGRFLICFEFTRDNTTHRNRDGSRSSSAGTTFTRPKVCPRPKLLPARQYARRQKSLPVPVLDGYPRVHGQPATRKKTSSQSAVEQMRRQPAVLSCCCAVSPSLGAIGDAREPRAVVPPCSPAVGSRHTAEEFLVGSRRAAREPRVGDRCAVPSRRE